MTAYRHKSLEGNDIRLLVLQAGASNSPITVSVCHSPLGSKDVAYDALSYSWGHDTAKSRILLDNCKFEVSENLSSALRHLRHRLIDRVLWVDAICINQEDLEERSKQVLRMDAIYHGAATVRVWLGPTADYSEFAMNHLRSMPAESFQGGLRGGGLSNMLGAIINLITRPWFRRRWVIQEIAFAKEVVLHCGYDTLQWSTFCDAIKAMNTNVCRDFNYYDPTKLRVPDGSTPALPRSGHQRDPDAQSATSLIFATENVLGQKLKAPTSHIARLCNLETLVEQFGSFFVSDKRDAIYTLLPLARDTYSSTEWKPDYEKDVLQVYKDFVTYSVQRTGSLDILVRPWAPERRDTTLQFPPRIPSWVACYWGPTSVISDGGGRIRELVEPLIGTADKRNYAASGSSRVAEINFVGNTLRVHGIWLGTILAHYNSLVETNSQENLEKLLLTADRVHGSLGTMFSIKTGRCYFISITGFIGLAPDISKEGDLICILFGCSIPVILRKEGTECILVGESYIDGFMQGEGMKEFEKGTYPLQEFLLV
jgi:Heterokaryon incompatibility protein (HET)